MERSAPHVQCSLATEVAKRGKFVEDDKVRAKRAEQKAPA